jgi:uncharacterized protein
MREEHRIRDVGELRAIVGEPIPRVIQKELPSLDKRSRAFVEASPFLVMSTAGPDGSCDASPKGGPPGFVKVLDERRLLVPEFPGNRRFDGLQNLVERPGIGLLFVVPGISETLRVNGFARLTRDPSLLERGAVDGKEPWFAADVEVRQVFSHCSKAFLRSHLWQPDRWPDSDTVPSPSRTIVERAQAEARRERDVRRDVEQEYEPGLY